MLEKGMLFDGRYRIEDYIGSGGMADIYLATDIQTDREIALKLLKEEFSDDRETVRRFSSEAKAVLGLSHEHIVKSYDVGEFCDCHYIALQYIRGKTLKKMIQENGSLDRERAIRIATQLTSALEHAHDNALIHRDVKSENILVEVDEQGRDKAYITDFGIARFLDINNTITYAGDTVLGSVRYVSPEQARGENVDSRSDIYSLGVVLYEMLTGKVPFDGENSMVIVLKHIEDPVVSPMTYAPDIGIALDEVVLKALEKSPENRYQSMKEFHQDLIKALRTPNKSIVRSREQQVRHQKRIRYMIISLCVVLPIMVGAAVFLLLQQKGQSGQYVEAIQNIDFRGLPFDEGQKLARKMNVVLEETHVVFDSNVSTYQITAQDIPVGEQLVEGQSVGVTVNYAGEAITMPDFVDSDFSSIEEGLAELSTDVVFYYETVAGDEEGVILRQSPLAGADFERGDTIELWINGQEWEQASMPSLVSDDVDTAIQLLKVQGFTNIFIQYAEGVDQTLSQDTVVAQGYVAGETVSKDAIIMLKVQRHAASPYSLSWAINIDVPENESNVMVMYTLSNGARVVAFDSIMAAGRQTLPFTIRSQETGDQHIQVLINDELVHEEVVELSEKNKSE